MPKWKILVSDGLQENGLERLRAESDLDVKSGISAAELEAVIGGYHALIVRSRTKVTAAILAKAGQLKVIGRAGVGVDNIDLAAASAHHVTVVNAPTSISQAVAEHTLGLIFALARQIPKADATMKSGQWLKNELFGQELAGKTLGVIGVGQIGARVAQAAEALGMQVLGHDPWLDDELIRQRHAEPVSLAELLHRSQFISIHIPLSPETNNLINSQQIAHMQPGVRLVCTARGGIIDETALLGGLENGQVGGAALDVFVNEPPGLTALISHPNVIATPHIASQTHEAQARASLDIAQEVLAALEGKPLRWKVV